MKKIMIAAAIVMLGIAANAAAVGWQCMGAANYKNSDYSVFVIGMNGVTSVEQITTLVAAGTSVDAYAFADGTVGATGMATVSSTASGKTITYSGSGTDTYQAFAIMWAADGKTATHTSVASISMENDSTAKTFGFGNQATNLANNQFEVAPEPTSGLLLLIGVAGLALRRRRA